jgi:hypothetical protein
MGQVEVYQWLLDRRSIGDDRFFSVAEVRKGLTDNGITGGIKDVRVDLLRLEAFKFLEVQYEGSMFNFHRKWRLSSSYLPATVKKKRAKYTDIHIAKIYTNTNAAKKQ